MLIIVDGINRVGGGFTEFVLFLNSHIRVYDGPDLTPIRKHFTQFETLTIDDLAELWGSQFTCSFHGGVGTAEFLRAYEQKLQPVRGFEHLLVFHRFNSVYFKELFRHIKTFCLYIYCCRPLVECYESHKRAFGLQYTSKDFCDNLRTSLESLEWVLERGNNGMLFKAFSVAQTPWIGVLDFFVSVHELLALDMNLEQIRFLAKPHFVGKAVGENLDLAPLQEELNATEEFAELEQLYNRVLSGSCDDF